MQRSRQLGYLFSILGGTCWALSGVCGQYLFQYHQLTSEWLVSVRLICAGVILLLLHIIKGHNVFAVWNEKNDIKDIIIFAIFGTAFCQYSYFSSVAASNAATATFIGYTSPIFIIIYTVIATKRRPAPFEIVSVCLVTIGIFVVATHGDIHSLYISWQSLTWGLLSAVTFGIYSIQPQRLMRKFSTLVVSGWGMLVGGVVLLLIFRPWNSTIIHNLQAYIAMGIIILFGTVLSYTLYLEGIKRIGAIQASLLSSIEPVIATLLSAVWLNESFEIIDLLGFAFILSTGITLAKAPKERVHSRSKRSESRNEPARVKSNIG
ncbi:DMT family transporter [Paenibacillus wynnii]|uniref:DMT family transporter n=1 Tax=Paenibacillus wynnii TaxID=268407 RepID=UPI00278F9754|nr:DMT family transporter [Paenibacillus wynnii]MDQ0194941.1 drug/metabolite transporter (DMT)-like permease [Paenibacillus wynnii]